MQRCILRARLPKPTQHLRSTRMASSTKARDAATPAMLKDYQAWRAMGEGGTSPTWEGYLSCLNMEKTVAYEDTLSPGIYSKPEKYAKGWSRASEAQKTAAHKSFLREALPERSGSRSRAKRYVFPQREKNAADLLDPEMKKVCSVNVC